MSADVRVVYRKFDGSLHWNTTLRRLGEDEHGVWLGADARVRWQRGAEPAVTFPTPHVLLFPRDVWWTATFNAAPAKTEIYCDIATVPRWTRPDEVTMIDLDLDVCRNRPTGAVCILDEDEFAVHQVKYEYPPEVVEAALRSAYSLREALANGGQPFADTYHGWLAQVC